jgi:hypothetical protein
MINRFARAAAEGRQKVNQGTSRPGTPEEIAEVGGQTASRSRQAGAHNNEATRHLSHGLQY